MYLRLDIEKIEHEKENMMIDDFLGNIAGLYELIYTFFLFIFGGFIDFKCKIAWIKCLY